jgi:hypothetical protein
MTLGSKCPVKGLGTPRISFVHKWVPISALNGVLCLGYPIRETGIHKLRWTVGDLRTSWSQVLLIFCALPCPEKARYSVRDVRRINPFFYYQHWVHAPCSKNTPRGSRWLLLVNLHFPMFSAMFPTPTYRNFSDVFRDVLTTYI